LEVRLSAPAIETLAVVAYRQPVLRAEIEAIRGVQCGEVLRQLIERELVRIVGRSEELGRPLLYGTTRQFLQVFGLRHLEDLPRPEFLPITKLVTEDSGELVAADPPTKHLQQFHQSREMQEETDMSITIDRKTTPESFGTASVTTPERPFTEIPTVYAAKSPDEDEDDEEEDDDLDDEPWEEVDDEDDDDDWDDDEDDDWEEEDDLEEEDDDWDDDDDDWEDDEEEEEEDDE
jgi:segregation and condensation protein B